MQRPRYTGTTYGFSRAATLMQARIRKASEGRGFSETRLLTHWADIVGQDVADIANPVDVTYARGGMGATLTLLTTGAQAPMLEMQKEQICEKVNACYGYRAISRIRITQTAPTGFAEGRVAFRAKKPIAKQPDVGVVKDAQRAAETVENNELRAALEALGTNVLSKTKSE